MRPSLSVKRGARSKDGEPIRREGCAERNGAALNR